MNKIFIIIILVFSMFACQEYTSKIIGKQYIPSRQGFGVGLTSNGKTGFVSTFENEKYILFIFNGTNHNVVECSKEYYFNCKDGDIVFYKWYGVTKIVCLNYNE